MKTGKFMVVLGLMAMATLGLAQTATAKTLLVVATFSILGDMVQQVGGEHVHVTTLVGHDGDPHAFEPSPNDARHLKEAQVVVINGIGLEGWMERLITASGFKGQPVVATEGVKTRRMEEDGKTVTDPHAWTSVANGVIYVQNIVKALAAADPTHAADYQASGKRYVQELEALDAQARKVMSAIPGEKRKILTTHDAMGYFGDAYGVTFVSPLGLSTESEASAGDVAKLIQQIKSEGIRVFFFENSNDPRLIRQIGEATGAQPGGTLYVESLSAPDGPASTYARMFQYNLDQMVSAMTAR